MVHYCISFSPDHIFPMFLKYILHLEKKREEQPLALCDSNKDTRVFYDWFTVHYILFLWLNMNTCCWCCCSVPPQVFIFRGMICSTPVLFVTTAQTFIDLSGYLKNQKTKLTQRGVKTSAEDTPASSSLYLQESSCSLWCFQSTGRVFTIIQRKRKVAETKTQVQHIKVQQVNGASGNKNYCVCNSETGEHLEIKQGTKIGLKLSRLIPV